MTEDLNIILNGNIVKGKPGETVLELANRHDIEIPTLCHDERLVPFTSCYLCVVEIEGFRGLQPACSSKIVEGMKIDTYNERIRKARKTALDLLVSNHYADCIAPCKETCPAGVDVQGYISYIDKGMYHEAVALIKETNPLPAICGRVCVRPCEVACRRNLLDEGAPVGIDYMKRFASDYDLDSTNKWKPEIKASTGKKVAVIGAGPAGLSCGFFLQKEGHQVDIFEAAPKAGGWLRYGIPEYRLPNDLLQKEVDNITEMGANIFYGKKLGDNLKYKELKDKYDSVIVTIGSQKGTLIGCEGDDAENVYPGIDFLKEMEISGEKYDFNGKKVIVVGGGNTAMDCCRTSMRCGAENVYVIYRRTENEMPANPIEIHESKLENIEYLFLTNPTRVNKDKDGKVKSMTCLKMELGEPDRSGRRRPIPIEGSEFEVEADIVLAAIGQKTEVNFIDDINNTVSEGELKTNRWGDISADEKTLQTGVTNVFAAGDGVTGPATLIQAIGQARLASHSCDQYLSGKEVEPPQKEFFSKKDNFTPQIPEDYKNKYPEQLREEMPTLNPSDRQNFKEVELGYASEEVAQHEANRCLECGCTELFTCDLKRHSTEYGAEQGVFEGDFKAYPVDFRHPFIEFDSNKCILCARCVRICNEVVGAEALGLVNRGFDTYVAPSMGDSLQDTTCENCGLCISTCPTGAITENVPFKPGPVKLEIVETICNYCSVGCKIQLHHKNGFVMQVTGAEGLINSDGNICRFPKFGYQYLNDSRRITRPLFKINGRFEEITFEEAYKIIAEKVKNVSPDENGFFAGARLTNEELHLIRKLAESGVKSTNIHSFHYLNRGVGYSHDSFANVPFDQISGANKIYLIGSEINRDNAVAGFIINQAQFKYKIPIELVTNKKESMMRHKVDSLLGVKSYYHFIKAVNYYLVANGFKNALFIKDQCTGFEEYRESLLKENFVELLHASGVSIMDKVIEFAKEINEQMNAVIVFSEKELCSNTVTELYNLALITGKLGKTSSGLLALKEKNNSQGLSDMGIYAENDRVFEILESGKIKNLLIFGEDPLGCTEKKVKVAGWLSIADFVAVQDYFMTDTAKMANLILPASFPGETGGSFTNTQRTIQNFEKVMENKVDEPGFQQLIKIIDKFGLNGLTSIEDVQIDAFSSLPEPNQEPIPFIYTKDSNCNRFFAYGCDILNKRFEEEFNEALGE